MNDDFYERLSQIGDELIIKLCALLNEKRGFDMASRLLSIVDDLTHLVAEISVKKNRREMI